MRHAIAVNSGTSALEIILRSLGIEGRDVLVPTNTFFATAAAVVHAGGNPVLLDMDPESFSVRPDAVEKNLTPKTAGMIVVHIGGIVSAQMPALVELANRKGLWLVEDAAHAHGSSLRSTKAGAFGIASSFSFYPTKVMTSAEGGMIVTNDDRIAEESRIYRDQGKASFTVNAHVRMGYNWRMSEPHAIIGLRHLERLPAMIADRRAIAAIYDRGLQGFRNLHALPVPAERNLQLLQVHRRSEGKARSQGAEDPAARTSMEFRWQEKSTKNRCISSPYLKNTALARSRFPKICAPDISVCRSFRECRNRTPKKCFTP